MSQTAHNNLDLLKPSIFYGVVTGVASGAESPTETTGAGANDSDGAGTDAVGVETGIGTGTDTGWTENAGVGVADGAESGDEIGTTDTAGAMGAGWTIGAVDVAADMIVDVARVDVAADAGDTTGVDVENTGVLEADISLVTVSNVEDDISGLTDGEGVEEAVLATGAADIIGIGETIMVEVASLSSRMIPRP